MNFLPTIQAMLGSMGLKRALLALHPLNIKFGGYKTHAINATWLANLDFTRSCFAHNFLPSNEYLIYYQSEDISLSH